MKIVGLYLFTFLIGLSVILSTNEKYKIRRDPSAIRQNYDFTNLRGSALEIAMRERVISHIEIVKSTDEFGLNLGHFAFKSESGESVFGCQFYKKVTLVFEAEGAASSGNKPVMEVEGPCQSSEDLSHIQANMIPIKKIMSEKPVDGDIQFNDGRPLSLKFLDLTDAWPDKWHLIGVRMSAPTQQFVIDRSEILKIIGQPILISTE